MITHRTIRQITVATIIVSVWLVFFVENFAP